MDEARRFLRYVTPGGLFLGETVGLLFLIFPTWVKCTLMEIKGDAGIGLTIAGLLATGALGFVLATIHHARFNRLPYSEDINFRDAVREFVRNHLIVVIDLAEDREVAPNSIDRVFAFAIVTSLWHQLTALSPRLNGVDLRAQQLADIAHSLGTAWVASTLAPIVVLTVAVLNSALSLSAEHVARIAGAAIIAGTLSWIFWMNHSTAARLCRSVVVESLADALLDPGLPSHPVRTHVLLAR